MTPLSSLTRRTSTVLMLALALALALTQLAFGDAGAPSGDNVTPTEITNPHNPDCVDVLGAGGKEIKDEPPKGGTVSDGTVTVTYNVANTPAGQVFNWSSNKALNAVIVKGGTTSNLYSYGIGDLGDTALHAPVNPIDGKYFALSHISFCYGAAPPPCAAANVNLDPNGVTTTYGSGNVTFTSTATGTAPVSVKWQVSTSGAAGPWTDIPGATTTTLTITDPTVAMSGNRYRAVFSNACGTDTSDNALLTVNPKAVTGAFTAADKVYDGNNSATILTRSIVSGVVGTDEVTLLGGSATFNDKNVGNGKPVTGTGFSLGGASAANYTLTSVSNTTANITPKPLTGACTVADKVYDGTTAATVTGSSLGAGVVAGDSVSLDGTNKSSAFGDPDVGNDKPTPCNGFALAGGDAGNYALTMSNTVADITPKALTGSCTVADKVYDGTTAANLTGSSIGGGVVGGDSVSLDSSAANVAFGDENVGNDKAVACSGFKLSGPDAANYTLTMNATAADITPKPISGTCTVANKVYDGTTNATVTGTSLTGAVAGDQVSLNGANASSAFANPDAGNGKPVSCDGYVLSGADAANYTLTLNPTTANITPKPIVGICNVADKDYDGTTDAVVTGTSLSGVVGSDDVSLGGGSAQFETPDPGNKKPVSCDGFALTGADKDNYAVTVVDTKATIRRPPQPDPVETCLRRPVFAFIRGGKQTKRVVFFLDGKKYGDVSKPDSQRRFGVRIDRRELGAGTHVLRATVYFTKASGRQPVKLIVVRLKPCLQGATIKNISFSDLGGKGCVSKAFLAFVKGDTISLVEWKLNGKVLKTMKVADGKGRYKVRIKPSQLRAGKNTLAAKVVYIDKSDTRTSVLRKTLKACK